MTTTTMVWYRNGGSRARNRYHAAREDWIRSGRALCGADIARPSFTFRDGEPVPSNGQCKACLARSAD